MSPFHLNSHGSAIVNCTLLDGKSCTGCKEHIDLESSLTEAQERVIEAVLALRAIETKRQQIRTKINSEHDPLTSRLPAEIVAEIFKATLTRKVPLTMEAFTIDSPLFLGAVCRSWRKIAWSTPSLWNWIHIFVCHPPSRYFGDLVKEWLDRSGNMPLVIQISCEDRSQDEDGFFFCPGFGLYGGFDVHVNACSSRWQYISFEVPTAFSPFLNGSEDGAPHLKMIRVSGTDYEEYHFTMKQQVRPTYMAFEYRPTSWGPQLNIAWDNLIDIRLAKFYANDCIKAIQQMPRLVRCVLVDLYNNLGQEELIPNGRFVLQSLELFFVDRVLTGSLFDHFIFPKLTHLHITYCGDNTTEFWNNSIKPFLMQSSARLQTLDFRLVPFEYESFAEALESTVSLRRLYLTNRFTWHGFDFFSFLVRLADTYVVGGPTQVSTFLPNLESISFVGNIPTVNNDKPLFTAILHAFGPRSALGRSTSRPLRRMVIESHGFPQIVMNKKNLRRVSALAEAGIDLQIIDAKTKKNAMLPYLPLRST